MWQECSESAHEWIMALHKRNHQQLLMTTARRPRWQLVHHVPLFQLLLELRCSGVVQECSKLCDDYSTKALSALSALQSSDAKTALTNIVHAIRRVWCMFWGLFVRLWLCVTWLCVRVWMWWCMLCVCVCTCVCVCVCVCVCMHVHRKREREKEKEKKEVCVCVSAE